MSLYVGNLPYHGVSERDLEDVFDEFGRIRSVRVREGFGFVEFDDDRDAEDAIRALNGRQDIGGRQIRVEWSRRGGSRGGGGGGRGPQDNDKCFKCGGHGHWARDCTGRSRSRSRGRRRSRSRSRGRRSPSYEKRKSRSRSRGASRDRDRDRDRDRSKSKDRRSPSPVSRKRSRSPSPRRSPEEKKAKLND